MSEKSDTSTTDGGLGVSGPVCFGAGTLIATPQGEATVETLNIGDLVLTEDGRAVPVKWVGRQTYDLAQAGHHGEPVRVDKDALGAGLPHTDLVVTGRHGICLDGLIIVAAALVNGTNINFVPRAELPDAMTIYHVETDAHEAILANGVAAESLPFGFAVRRLFDNHQDYLDRYGAERIIPEMTRPRIKSQRMIPAPIKTRLGLCDTECDWRTDAA